jgi:fructose-1,6-bisphosphatase
VTLRSVGGEAVDAGDDGSSGVNAFGDRQLKADVAADTVLFQKLRECGAVEIASSEENTAMVPMGGSGYSVRRLSCVGQKQLDEVAHFSCR